MKRYNVCILGNYTEDPNGQFVKYEDVEEVLSGVAILAEKYEIKKALDPDSGEVGGIYLKKYNVRLATFHDNTQGMQDLFRRIMKQEEG